MTYFIIFFTLFTFRLLIKALFRAFLDYRKHTTLSFFEILTNKCLEIYNSYEEYYDKQRENNKEHKRDWLKRNPYCSEQDYIYSYDSVCNDATGLSILFSYLYLWPLIVVIRLNIVIMKLKLKR